MLTTDFMGDPLTCPQMGLYPPTSHKQSWDGSAIDAILRKESPASAGPLFQVLRRCTSSDRNRFALLDPCVGNGRIRPRYRLTLLLCRLRSLTFLPRKFRGAQLPRPIAQLVTHDRLLSVSTPAFPSRILRVVALCYAWTWSDVHTVSGVKRRSARPGSR